MANKEEETYIVNNGYHKNSILVTPEAGFVANIQHQSLNTTNETACLEVQKDHQSSPFAAEAAAESPIPIQ